MLEVNAVSNVQVPNMVLNTSGNTENAFIGYARRPIYVNNPMRGLDTIGVYNAAMLVKKMPVDKEPLPLIYNPDAGVDSIKGERILSSDGQLVAIVSKDDKTETYYEMEDGDVKNISVKDAETGKEIKSQYIYKITLGENGQDAKRVSVTEHASSDNAFDKTTEYENGIFVENYINKDISKDRHISMSYRMTDECKNNPEAIYIDLPDGNTMINVNDKQQITGINNYIEKGNMSYIKHTEFYNGCPITEREEISHSHTIPNTAGLDIVNDSELKPAERYVIDENAKSNEGEKTYYSNGAIEKNTLPNGVTYYYTPQGDVQKIIDGNKTITIHEDSQTIEENLGDSKVKTTFLFKFKNEEDGYEVNLTDKDNYKNLYCDTNGIPHSYEEGTIDADKMKHPVKSLYFNKQGMLTEVYNR